MEKNDIFDIIYIRVIKNKFMKLQNVNMIQEQMEQIKNLVGVILS